MLRDMRMRKELKQSELASKVGVSQAMISRYEDDPSKLRSASFDIIMRYADALGIGLDEFSGMIEKYLTK